MASTALWLALLLGGSTAASTNEARTLARRSMLEYDTGDYAKALGDAERAYEIDPRPTMLFNLGQCHRALGHYREAAHAFKSYLRDVPAAKDRGHVEALIAEMERQAQKAARPPPAPQPAPILVLPATPAPAPAPIRRAALPPAPVAAVTAPPAKRHVPAAAWWLGGSGIGVAVVGTVLFGLAESSLSADHPVSLGGGVTEHQLTHSAFDSAATMGNAGEVLWAVGGALLAGGAVVAGVGSSK